MKHCPECNRVETDEALKFCRVDGATLVDLSSPLNSEAGTTQLGSDSAGNEIETSVLPHRTDANIDRATAATTVLPPQPAPSTTSELSRPKRSKAITLIVAAVAVAILIGGYFYFSRNRSAAIQSIAVMPFVNESANADVEYLSDGMTETLIGSLSQLPNLNVKARSTVFRYKGKATDAKTIGKELNVQAVLNGRVMQRADQLTLSLELVNAETENVIWSEQYNRKQSDLVTLQSEIAKDVSTKLKSKLSGADVAKVEKNYTANAEAYQLYLKGRFYWNKRTGESLSQSVEFYNQAIAKDPNYALAYAGLSNAYSNLAQFAGMPADTLMKARDAARKAVSLDDNLAEAHTGLAFAIQQFDYNFAESEREFRRAIQLNPNYATAHQWYGNLLSILG